MWVKITAPFEWRPSNNQVIVYKVGNSYCVTRSCGELAVSKGAAIEIPAPNKDEANGVPGKTDKQGKAAKTARRNTKSNKG